MSRETDAKVAEALGWSLRRFGRGIPPNCEGMKHPVAYPHYSTSPADAIAALEATGAVCILAMQGGKVWICKPGENEQQALNREPDGVGQPWMAAAAAAIIAWRAAKGGA